MSEQLGKQKTKTKHFNSEDILWILIKVNKYLEFIKIWNHWVGTCGLQIEQTIKQKMHKMYTQFVIKEHIKELLKLIIRSR